MKYIQIEIMDFDDDKYHVEFLFSLIESSSQMQILLSKEELEAFKLNLAVFLHSLQKPDDNIQVRFDYYNNQT